MQGVLVFASAAARDAAITSPQEGQFAYLKDTNVTTYYTGSAWTNLDTTGMTNPMTTTGDMVYSSSGSTPARLGIGSTGQVITVAGGIPSWATPATASFVGCAVNITTNQTLTNGATTVVDFANEVFDTNGFHSNVTNPSRITIPTGYAGKYVINAGVVIGDKTTGRMITVINKNGTPILQTNLGNNSSQSGGEINGVLDLAVADYITFAVYQASGSDASTGTDGKYNRFSAIYLGA
jgi:hypothetical protein